MAFTSSAAVLDSVKAVIEATVPGDNTGADDRFRVQIAATPTITGNRAVLLSGMGGKRKHLSGRTSVDWEAQFDLTIYYNDVLTEAGQPSVDQRALRDSEDLLAAIYDWAAATVGINQIDPDFANVANDGQGEIQASRTIRVEFQRA